jgi:hypothetical protein
MVLYQDQMSSTLRRNFSQIKKCQNHQDFENQNHKDFENQNHNQNHSQNLTRKMAGLEKTILSNKNRV